VTERGCPDDQRLSAWVDGHLDEPDRAAVVAHVDACAICLEHVTQLATLAESAPADAPATLVQAALVRPVSWPRRLVPVAAAAAGIVVAVTLWRTPEVASPVGSPQPGTVGPVRATPTLSSALVVEQPADNEQLLQGFEVRWQGPAGTVFSEVKLTTPSGDLLWSAHVQGDRSQVVVPVALPHAQQSYLWVTAHLPEGRRLASNVIRVRGRRQP
jgi:hypothetical protein